MQLDIDRDVKNLAPGFQHVHLKWKVVMLTPELAVKLLAQNHPENRRLKFGKISQIEADLQANNGDLSYDPIVLDEDGFMVNGQNRCTAVVGSDIALPVLMITNFPKKSLRVSDQGTPRNVVDIARMSGHALPHGERQYASVARLMMVGLRSNMSVSIQMTLDFIKRHKAALEFAFEQLPKNTRFLTQGPVRAVVARAYYQKDYHKRIGEFCTMLLDGLPNNRNTDTAVIILRNWLLQHSTVSNRDKGGRGRPRQSQIYAKTERALKAFLTEENITKILETSKELFPIP